MWLDLDTERFPALKERRSLDFMIHFVNLRSYQRNMKIYSGHLKNYCHGNMTIMKYIDKHKTLININSTVVEPSSPRHCNPLSSSNHHKSQAWRLRIGDDRRTLDDSEPFEMLLVKISKTKVISWTGNHLEWSYLQRLRDLGKSR